MRVPEHWLRELVDFAPGTEALAERLTMAGHEVDAVLTEGEGLDRVAVAEVRSIAPHPEADRLSVCEVEAGEGRVRVVCGAPNVTVGMKAALARPGATLHGGRKIEAASIRGIESSGMLCSLAELGLGEDAEGILRLPDDAPVGQPLAAFLGLPDRVLDLDLTPNRGDCFSMLGMAREVAALTGGRLQAVEPRPVPPGIDDTWPVVVERATVCPRFAGRVLRGLDPAASTPLWMAEKLRRCGIRTIHPVVDVTNYVMLELGQPMHAYDLDRVSGAIRPRLATEGERAVLLDGRELALTENTIAISDDSGVIGLAGIMGGASTAVSGETTCVFLESAYWPREAIVGRARAYALHTDASLRFERGVDPAGQARAIERATALLMDIAGGRPGPVVDQVAENELPRRPALTLRRERLARVLGYEPEAVAVGDILRGLGLGVDDHRQGWRVQPASWRFDLEVEDDLIEEVARIHGYDRIPEVTATAALPLRAPNEAVVSSERLADAMIARDYREVITYSFIDADSDRRFSTGPSGLVLSNPLSSDMAVMRSSLWPGMLRAAASNVARQQPRVRLFELGTTFAGTAAEPRETPRLAALATGDRHPEQWGVAAAETDFFDLKGDLESLLGLTGAAETFAFAADEHPALQPGQAARITRDGRAVGCIGKLHPSLGEAFDITQPVYLFELELSALAAPVPRAAPVSRFPAIRRDLAVVVDDDVAASDLLRAAKAAVADVIRDVLVFDIYRGPGIEAGRKSVALGLILQDSSRTLTDEDADSAMAATLASLEHEFAAVLRD